jgi:hypothetical protein
MRRIHRSRLPGQSRESDLFAKPDRISIAQEAQLFPFPALQRGERTNKKQIGSGAARGESWILKVDCTPEVRQIVS